MRSKKLNRIQSATALVVRAEALERRQLLSGSDPDAGFGVGGVQKLDYQNLGGDSANVIVPLANGKVVVAGYGDIPGVSPTMLGSLARYNGDGTLDLSFGQDGKAVAGDGQIVNATTVAGGKLLVLWLYRGSGLPCLTRLNADGSVDTTFGSPSGTWPGTVELTSNMKPSIASCGGLAVTPDGRLLIAGTFAGDLLVRCYTPDGVLDSTFGSAGQATIDLPSLLALNYIAGDQAIGIDANGRVLVGLTARTGVDYTNPVTALSVRLNPDGSPDTTFGTNGVSVPTTPSNFYVTGMTVDTNGRPVASIDGPDVSLVRWNTTGQIDTSFSGDGIATLSIPTPLEQARSVTAGPDGSLIVSGVAGTSALLAKFTNSGAPDATFGTGGWIGVNGGSDSNKLNTVALLPGGQILAAGRVQFGGYAADNTSDFLIARVNGGGQLDPSWGTGGIVRTSGFHSGSDVGMRSFLLPNGQTLVTSTSNWYGTPYSVSRLNADGSRDLSFGTRGQAVGPQGDYEQTFDVAYANQQLVMLGGSYSAYFGSFRLQRFDANGAIDTSFGTRGSATVALPAGGPTLVAARSVIVLPDNRVQVIGIVSGRQIAIFRFTAQGQPDTSLNGNGIQLLPQGVGGATLNDAKPSMTLLPDGSTLIATAVLTSPNDPSNANASANAIIKLKPDGTLDTTFATGGQRIISGPAFNSINYLNNLTVQPDGKLVAVGFSELNPGSNVNRLAVAFRLNTDGSLDTSFGTNGRVLANFGSRGSVATAVRIESDGRIVLSGKQQDAITTSISTYFVDAGAVAMRLLPNGSPDTGFGSAGIYKYASGVRNAAFTDVDVLPDGRLLFTGTTPNGFRGNDVLLVRMAGSAQLVDAGGPYSAIEGSAVTLGASVSGADRPVATWEWDLDYDGVSFTADVTGQTISVPAGDGPRTRMIAVRAVDSAGVVSANIGLASLDVSNAAPTGTSFGSSYPTTPGKPALVGFGSASDPSEADVAAGLKFSFDFNNDGDFVDAGEVVNSANSYATFTYNSAGNYTVRGRVSDKDGAYADYFTQVLVNPAPPTDPTSITLEAENSLLGSGTVKSSAHAGYTGTGFADMGGTGSTIKWTFSRNGAGQVTLSLRYANGGTTNRPANVLVNGISIGTLAMAPTGGWSKWVNATITAELTATVNTVLLVGNTSSNVNVDSLTITTGSTPPPPSLTGSISGFLFDDVNKNGLYDAGDTQPVGRRVFLDANNNGVIDSGEITVNSAANGSFSFSNLPAGTYRVREVLPANTAYSTAAVDVTLSAGQVISNLAIGTKSMTVLPPPVGTAGVSGIVFNDNNKNAKFDSGDGYAKGAVVFLDTDNDGKLDAGELSTTTDDKGKYSFTGLAAGTYRVRRTFPVAGYTYSTPLLNPTLVVGQTKTGQSIGTKKV